jgi:ATP-dependent protease ClpP protease subunit
MPQPKLPSANPPPENKNWYTIRAKSEDTAEVLIYGDIGDSWYGESVTAQQFVKELQALGDKNLVVRINSYGGSVSDGAAIYNAIKRHPKSKTVEIDGVAVSIASLIAMAGDTVNIAANALFMVHAPWGYAIGNSAEMRKYADVLDKYAEAMATSYASKTGKTAEEIYELLSDGADHWYTAQEAKDAGFVNAITTATQDEESARYQQAALARFKIPAAAAARFAAVAAQLTPNKEIVMPLNKDPAADPKPDNVVEIEKVAEAKAQAKIAARNEEISDLFALVGTRAGANNAEFAELHRACLADTKLTVAEVRKKIMDKLGEGSESLAGIASGRAIAGEDARDKQRIAMVGSLAARMGAEKADGANPYRGMRLHELARACLQASGVKVDGLSMMDLAAAALTRQSPRGAQTTSDFPVILENTMHKLVLTGFMAQTATWQRFCKTGTVSDFRAWNRLVPGLLGNLDTVNEAGEYVNKNIPDAQKESIQATRKGNIINVTPEVLVNDDIGYIQSMASGLGATGQRAIERAVYAVLNSNPVMADGNALYSVAHGNLAAVGAVPSVITLDAARQALMSQTAPGTDAEYLDIQPAVAVVPLAQGGNTRVIVNAVYDPDTANKLQRPNMVNGMVKDIVDSPRVAGTVWHILADPNVAPIYEVVFLDGQQTPALSEEVNFRTSGLAWKIELPFGVGAISWRGGYRNAGA